MSQTKLSSAQHRERYNRLSHNRATRPNDLVSLKELVEFASSAVSVAEESSGADDATKERRQIQLAHLQGAFGKAGNNLPWLQATRRYAYDLLEDLGEQYREFKTPQQPISQMITQQPTQYPPTQYSPTQYSPTQYPQTQDPPTQYRQTQYPPTQQQPLQQAPTQSAQPLSEPWTGPDGRVHYFGTDPRYGRYTSGRDPRH